jgi:hypothetical protein
MQAAKEETRSVPDGKMNWSLHLFNAYASQGRKAKDLCAQARACTIRGVLWQVSM